MHVTDEKKTNERANGIGGKWKVSSLTRVWKTVRQLEYSTESMDMDGLKVHGNFVVFSWKELDPQEQKASLNDARTS